MTSRRDACCLHLNPLAGGVQTLTFSADGRYLGAIAADQSVQVWLTAAWQSVSLSGSETAAATAIAFAAESDIVAIATETGHISLLSLTTAAGSRQLQSDFTTIAAVTLSSDGQLAAAADSGGNLALWMLNSPADQPFQILENRVESVVDVDIRFSERTLILLLGTRQGELLRSQFVPPD